MPRTTQSLQVKETKSTFFHLLGAENQTVYYSLRMDAQAESDAWDNILELKNKFQIGSWSWCPRTWGKQWWLSCFFASPSECANLEFFLNLLLGPVHQKGTRSTHTWSQNAENKKKIVQFHQNCRMVQYHFLQECSPEGNVNETLLALMVSIPCENFFRFPRFNYNRKKAELLLMAVKKNHLSAKALSIAFFLAKFEEGKTFKITGNDESAININNIKGSYFSQFMIILSQSRMSFTFLTKFHTLDYAFWQSWKTLFISNKEVQKFDKNCTD